MEWFFLSLFLLFLVFIMTLLYASAITTRVNPTGVPVIYGSYGVEPGVTGNVLDTYNVDGLNAAINRCDIDPRCTSFYFEGKTMSYLKDDGARYSGQLGGTYRRQLPLIKDKK